LILLHNKRVTITDDNAKQKDQHASKRAFLCHKDYLKLQDPGGKGILKQLVHLIIIIQERKDLFWQAKLLKRATPLVTAQHHQLCLLNKPPGLKLIQKPLGCPVHVMQMGAEQEAWELPRSLAPSCVTRHVEKTWTDTLAVSRAMTQKELFCFVFILSSNKRFLLSKKRTFLCIFFCFYRVFKPSFIH
jgi:hypothetical protein